MAGQIGLWWVVSIHQGPPQKRFPLEWIKQRVWPFCNWESGKRKQYAFPKANHNNTGALAEQGGLIRGSFSSAMSCLCLVNKVVWSPGTS